MTWAPSVSFTKTVSVLPKSYSRVRHTLGGTIGTTGQLHSMGVDLPGKPRAGSVTGLYAIHV